MDKENDKQNSVEIFEMTGDRDLDKIINRYNKCLIRFNDKNLRQDSRFAYIGFVIKKGPQKLTKLRQSIVEKLLNAIEKQGFSKLEIMQTIAEQDKRDAAYRKEYINKKLHELGLENTNSSVDSVAKFNSDIDKEIKDANKEAIEKDSEFRSKLEQLGVENFSSKTVPFKQ